MCLVKQKGDKMVVVKGMSKKTQKRLAAKGVKVRREEDARSEKVVDGAMATARPVKELSPILQLKAKLKGKIKHFQRLSKQEVCEAIALFEAHGGVICAKNKARIEELEAMATMRSQVYAAK